MMAAFKLFLTKGFYVFHPPGDPSFLTKKLDVFHRMDPSWTATNPWDFLNGFHPPKWWT